MLVSSLQRERDEYKLPFGEAFDLGIELSLTLYILHLTQLLSNFSNENKKFFKYITIRKYRFHIG